MILNTLISILLISSKPIASCNGYTVYKNDSTIVVLNPLESKISELKIHGEDVPEVRLIGKGRLVAFYPASYRLSVIDSGNNEVFQFYPNKNWFELESYSAFDAQGDLIALAYFMDGETHFIAFKSLKMTIERTYTSLYPAGIWIRDGRIFLRLYRVENNTVTEDFILSLDDGQKWNIPKVIAVDFDGKTIVFASREKIIVIKDRKIEKENAKGIVLDVKLSGGIPLVLVQIQGDGIFLQKGKNLIPIINPTDKFIRCQN